MISTFLASEGAAKNPLIPESYDLLWSSVVFVILLAVFWVKVLPNFKKALDERTEAIEGRLEAAEKAQAEAAAKTANIEAEVAKEREALALMKAEARADAVAIAADIKATAQAEAERALVTAKAQIEAERQAAVNSLRNEVGTLALDLASSIVGASLKNDKVATGVVDQFLADLEAGDKAGKKK